MNSVPRSRSLEAVLLFWVAGMHAFQLAQIQLSVTDTLDEEILLYWTPLFITSYLFHFVLRFKARAADSLLLPLATLMNGLGISMIYRLDLAEVARGNEQMLGARQVWLTVFAMLVAAGLVWLLKNHMVLKRYTYIAMALGILLLLTPMLPVIGREINGARLWINIGELSFQPGEIAKLLLIVFFAGYLTKHRESLSLIGKKIWRVRIPRARDLGPLLLVWFASLGVLVLQRDLGTSLLYFGIFLGLLYIATGRGFYAAIGIGMIISAGLVASQLLGYVGNRFDSWLNPFVSE
ncbi:MAG: FtsW/RodA/SpoVE family cell cycle protein, partial [Microbacteriaceae bacterium]|nr:FtsW/RodA/SpoVE family cell cycle protein [Microbacteriaceae bacterium]